MPWPDGTPAPEHMEGWLQLEQMAIDTLDALAHAGLHDVRLEINRRIFERDATDLHDIDFTPSGGTRVVFKPFVELLLVEVAATARLEELDAEAKRARIRQTIERAGF